MLYSRGLICNALLENDCDQRHGNVTWPYVAASWDKIQSSVCVFLIDSRYLWKIHGAKIVEYAWQDHLPISHIVNGGCHFKNVLEWLHSIWQVTEKIYHEWSASEVCESNNFMIQKVRVQVSAIWWAGFSIALIKYFLFIIMLWSFLTKRCNYLCLSIDP